MGINYNMGLYQILLGKRKWQEFSENNFLMLGKQEVNFTCGKLKEILDRRGFKYRKDIIDIDDYDDRNKNIDSCDLLKLLGFKEICVLDISDYEGADIILDLSTLNLPEELINRFDYIYDGGVLEHIFNAPQALLNISKMVKMGGRIIHDVPGGGWIDHGFYTFSPTFFIDYYTNNGFFINDIHMVGYNYSQSEEINVISPDCRYNDINKWANIFARGYNILLVCDAIKFENVKQNNISFMQYSYKKLYDTVEKNEILYSYEYKIKKAKEIYCSNNSCRIAIYGTGSTANNMIRDLAEIRGNIIGVYDRNYKVGEVIQFDTNKATVLDINKIHEDKIEYIICGSKVPCIIDEIRQRIKYLKKEGVEII